MFNKINFNEIPIIEDENHHNEELFEENNMTSGFFPDNYEPKEPASNYLVFKKEGTYRIRIMSTPQIGYEYFNKENKPIRSREPFEEQPADIKDKGKIKEFYAFEVWNCNDKLMQIMKIDQQTIKEPIFALNKEPEYGDPRGYDIKITREGLNFNDTKYTIIAMPPSLPTEEMTEAHKKFNVNWDEYFSSRDPFKK